MCGMLSPSLLSGKTRALVAPRKPLLLREDDEDVEHVDEVLVVDEMEPRWRFEDVSSAAALLSRR